MAVLVFAAVVTAALDGLTKELATAHLIEGRLYGVEGAWGLRLLRNQRGAMVGLPSGSPFSSGSSPPERRCRSCT